MPLPMSHVKECQQQMKCFVQVVTQREAENAAERGRLGYVVQSNKKGLVRLPAPDTQNPTQYSHRILF